MEKTYSGRTFRFYDSIKEIPAGRLLGFQVQLSQHSACGSTFEELDAATERLGAFLAAGRVADAYGEYKNRRMGFWQMFENINTSTATLANLVKEINGIPVSVRTDADAMRVARLIEETDISSQEVDEIIQSVKKNLTLN